MRAKEAAASQRSNILETQMAELKAEHARKLGAAEVEAAQLKAQLQQQRAEMNAAVTDAQLTAKLEKRKREAQEEINKVVQQQLAQAQQQAASMQAQLEQALQRANRAEADVAALQGSSMQMRIRLLEEDLRQAKEALAHAHSRALLAQQPQQAAATHAAAAGPGRYAASAQQAAADAEPDASATVDAQLAALQQALAAINQAASRHMAGPLPAASPSAAAQAVVQLLDGIAALRQGLVAKAEAEVQLRTMATNSDKYAQELQKQLVDARARLEQALTAESVAQRRAEALTQERDRLRTALLTPVSVENPDSVGGRLLSGQQAAALQQLQAFNQQLQEQVAKLHADATAQAAALETQALACKSAATRADAAELRARQLEKEADALAKEVASLQERLGRGEMGLGAGMRVLHLRHNPDAEAQRAKKEAELARLAAENEALREQLSELEQQQQQAALTIPASENSHRAQAPAAAVAPPQHVQGPALGSGVATAVKDAEILLLRRQVAEAGKAMTRLKLVFKERIMVFREACYSLFGYRVDMTAEATAAADAADAPTTFTLKPQHADDPSALLVFRSAGGAGGARMELVPNAFTSTRLAREVDTFVRKFNSIPAFTANLTMENFQKQTQC